jgi:alpha-mannosidase
MKRPVKSAPRSHGGRHGEAKSPPPVALAFNVSINAAAAGPWLKGYEKTVIGEKLMYHSPYPGLSSALLVRAKEGWQQAEWETEPVPAAFREAEATFIIMAGLATGKGGHRFTLRLDGEPAATFATGRDSASRTWSVDGGRGIALSFQTAFVDQFDELFGFLFLRVPRALLKAGRPLRLSLSGEAAGSDDWVMVFERPLATSFVAQGEPALVKKGGGLMQPVRMEVSHIAPPADAVVTRDGAELERLHLETGYNLAYVHVPAAEARFRGPVPAERTVELAVTYADGGRLAFTLRLRPVVRRDLYFLPHSHLDIGYSDHQDVVEKKHWGYYEQAIELAKKTAGYPEGARFKWNVEQLWPVESYLAGASEAKKRAFFEAVKKGWIGLQALFANELTGVCHPEELFHLTDFARRLAKESGVAIDTAMVTDIPGSTWSVVPAFAQSGVRYFSSGPNYMPFLPDGGDRIGNALKAWADRPFYWVGPSGQDKILFWMAGRGYSWFHGLNMGSIERAPRRSLFDYLDELDAKGYPYSVIQVRYTVGGDNGPPDPNLPDFVRAWNEEYVSPRLVIATAGEMFAELEKRHGDIIPAAGGDFTPYWEDGVASTACETALNRRSAERLLQAETLWAMAGTMDFPAAEFAAAWREVVLWDEHTWGAHDSVSNPDGENARSQWEYKRGIALRADQQSRGLLERAMARAAGGAGKSAGRKKRGSALDIINTCSWPRTDIAIVPAELSRAGDLVKDEAGLVVPSQRLTTGELAVLAAGVPAFGAKRYSICRGSAEGESAGQEADNQPPAGRPARAKGLALENGFISAVADPLTGALRSLRWTCGTGETRELVDTSEEPGLDHYLYVPGRDPAAARGPGAVKTSAGETGPLVASLVVESDAPGARGLRREYRLFRGLDRLEVTNILDKDKVRQKESVHFAFPFAVPEPRPRVDAGWGLVRAETDQLPGANRDYFCPQNAVDVSNADWGVTWVTLDAPLAEIGRMNDETLREANYRVWRKTLEPSSRLYSYAMNNSWHTNYKADQEGRVTLRYAVRPHLGFEAAAVRRAGMEAARPFVVVEARGGRRPGLPLAVEPAAFVVTSLRPAADEKRIIMRVYNPSGRPETLRLGGALAKRRGIYLSDPAESKREKVTGHLLVPAFGVLTLRL